MLSLDNFSRFRTKKNRYGERLGAEEDSNIHTLWRADLKRPPSSILPSGYRIWKGTFWTLLLRASTMFIDRAAHTQIESVIFPKCFWGAWWAKAAAI